ncbi:calmodulin-like protein 4 isoform X2 [Daphnia carinata]|uniref:calmodulin-like protein 4 isoform X2 n=1 Tax=Daphnia carinata TaxID=120202 RepID=UPI00257ADBE2|nr:calmodulin-like protein 4 isoform X2 [Daphnia carinata]
MARHFKEQDIAEFRDCFSLYARNDYVDSLQTLMVIMRSLRTSPTPPELKQYMKNGKISFADFLEIMHTHTVKEKSSRDIQAAFKAADTHGRGVISYKELHHILSGWGEKLTAKEVEQIFREAHIKPNAPVKYEDFIKVVTSPVPDYYY